MDQHATGQPNTSERPALKRSRRKRVRRAKAENAKRHPNVQRLGWTIDEWAAANAYSRSFVEKLRRQGRGPREIREGNTVRITPAADAEWRAAREGKPAGIAPSAESVEA
jgi:hypothetical protein